MKSFIYLGDGTKPNPLDNIDVSEGDKFTLERLNTVHVLLLLSEFSCDKEVIVSENISSGATNVNKILSLRAFPCFTLCIDSVL